MRVHVCWLRNDISTVEGCAREEPCLHWLAFAAVANSHRRLTLSVTANITFLRPAKSGYVYADAAEVFNHHRIPFVEVKITNEKGELIAIFTSSGYRKETELPVEDLE